MDEAPRAAAHGGAQEDAVVDVDEQRGGLAAVLFSDAVERLEGEVALLLYMCVRVCVCVCVMSTSESKPTKPQNKTKTKRTSSFSMTALSTTQARRRETLVPSTSRPSEPWRRWKA